MAGIVVLFYGYVQGIGFRWRARNAVNIYGCTGWCKNEWDGSVSMEIQETEEAIDSVILAIEKGGYVKIQDMSVKTIPIVEYEYSFRTS